MSIKPTDVRELHSILHLEEEGPSSQIAKVLQEHNPGLLEQIERGACLIQPLQRQQHQRGPGNKQMVLRPTDTEQEQLAWFCAFRVFSQTLQKVEEGVTPESEASEALAAERVSQLLLVPENMAQCMHQHYLSILPKLSHQPVFYSRLDSMIIREFCDTYAKTSKEMAKHHGDQPNKAYPVAIPQTMIMNASDSSIAMTRRLLAAQEAFDFMDEEMRAKFLFGLFSCQNETEEGALWSALVRNFRESQKLLNEAEANHTPCEDLTDLIEEEERASKKKSDKSKRKGQKELESQKLKKGAPAPKSKDASEPQPASPFKQQGKEAKPTIDRHFDTRAGVRHVPAPAPLAKPLSPTKYIDQMLTERTYEVSTHARIERWEQVRSLAEIHAFTDTVEGASVHRYAGMDEQGLVNQLRRHYFPRLTELLRSDTFRKNYCKQTDRGLVIQAQLGATRGFLSIGISPTGVLYHAFFEPLADIMPKGALPHRAAIMDRMFQDGVGFEDAPPMPGSLTASIATITCVSPERGKTPHVRIDYTHPASPKPTSLTLFEK